ncbi:MAG: CobD/CbiB family cobalamin biosynthesis protein [Halanaeroarchaeum sp.]
MSATLAIAVAFALDRLVGEPPESFHPVVWFGTVVDRFDRDWPRPGVLGAGVAVFLPLGAALVAGGAVAVAATFGRLPGLVAAGFVLFVSVSLGSLVDTGSAVIREAATDPDRAATDARSLVGRDTATLGSGAIRSAAVESVAENLADGLVGPLLAFALGSFVSLPVAAGATAWVKGVNTLDSMLGYRTHPMGRGSARLDDVVAWLPARLSAALLAIAAANPGTLRTASRWAHAPASPNSGWPMVTIAAVLDVSLVKPGAYALIPGRGLPDESEAVAGVRIVERAGVLAFVLAGVIAWF